MEQPSVEAKKGNGAIALKGQVAVTTQRALILQEALKEDTEQRQLLARFVKEHMVEGTDYGTIPGTERIVKMSDGTEAKVSPKCLLKPGAEKLVDLYRCTAKYKIRRIEDWDKGFFHYEFTARLVTRDTDMVLAEGVGSANSRESKHRWRNAKYKCPDCGQEAILKSKDRPEFFCWAKRGGCGAKFSTNDERITGQSLGKVENVDIYDQANTILKMGKKRALVDAAITLARCSDMFTQDLEEFIDAEPILKAEVPVPAKVEPPKAPNPSPPAAAAQKKVEQTGADAEEKKAIRARAKRLWETAQKHVVLEQFQQWCLSVLGRASKSTDWTSDDLDHLEASLPLLIAPPPA